jgi:hypothetical protein
VNKGQHYYDFLRVMQSMTNFERSSILIFCSAACFSHARIFCASLGDIIFCGALGFMVCAAENPQTKLKAATINNVIGRGMTHPLRALLNSE